MNSTGGYIYLLYGEDTFSRDEAVLTLKTRMRTLPAGEHNLTELVGDEATLASLRAVADSAPFLAERRLVVARGLIGRLQGRGAPGRGGVRRRKAVAGGPDELAALLAYLVNVPATSSIAFVESDRIEPSMISAAVPRGRGIIKEFPRQWDAADWVRRRARTMELDLDVSAVRELGKLGAEDLRRLDSELRKLAAYANGRTVSRVDVDEVVIGRDAVTWALLDALAERRRDAALMALRRLFQQGESPEALLGRDVIPLYLRLVAAKEFAGVDRRIRATFEVSGLGLNPRALPKLVDQVSRFEPRELDCALDILLDLDRRSKTGEVNLEVGLELAVLALCGNLSGERAL